MINAHIEKTLQGQYPYVKKEDGTFVFCAEGNQEKMGSAELNTIRKPRKSEPKKASNIASNHH